MLDSDMVKCFEDDVFLAVKAPPGTRLEVPVINHNVSKFVNNLFYVNSSIFASF